MEVKFLDILVSVEVMDKNGNSNYAIKQARYKILNTEDVI